MSNMKKYTCDCIKQADDSAQAVRNLASMASTKDQHHVVRSSMARAINQQVTELQNLVNDMAEQLERERAEVERMERLYKMARKDIQDLKDDVALLKYTPEGFDPDVHRRVNSDGTY